MVLRRIVKIIPRYWMPLIMLILTYVDCWSRKDLLFRVVVERDINAASSLLFITVAGNKVVFMSTSVAVAALWAAHLLQSKR